VNLLDAARENQELLWWLGAFSVISFVGSVITIPILISRLPEDYFVDKTRHRLPWSEHHPVLRWMLLILKNLLGVLLILAGIVMIPLPGQGLLVILIGIMVTNFPGKFRVERYVVNLPAVRTSLNWIRAKADKPPLILR
jgi:hypothetical protein